MPTNTITDDNEAPLVLIIALLLLSFTWIAFSLKLIVKIFRKAKATAYDDWLLVSAVVRRPESPRVASH